MPPPTTTSVWQIAFGWPVVKRAFIISALVGIILVLINHGPCILDRHFNITCLWQSVLTFCVPYTVSTVSSVLAVRDQQRTFAAQSSLRDKNREGVNKGN